MSSAILSFLSLIQSLWGSKGERAAAVYGLRYTARLYQTEQEQLNTSLTILKHAVCSSHYLLEGSLVLVIPLDMEDEDDQKHANEIRLLIEECQHQISFLTKSQESLQEALVDDPTDADFLEAIEENKHVIAHKHSRIKKLQDSLYRASAAYRAERKREEVIENRRSASLLIAAIESSNDNEIIPIDHVSVSIIQDLDRVSLTNADSVSQNDSRTVEGLYL